MSVPVPGDRVKVVERSTTTDTKIVSEGTVAAVDEAANRIDFEGMGRARLTDTAGVNVRVDIVNPPPPNTVGSVLRIDNTTYMLHTDGRWHSTTDSVLAVSYIQQVGFTVVYDAGA